MGQTINKAILGLLCCAALLGPRAAEAAGGAFAVDDSEVGKPGSCKVESWASFATNDNFNAVTSPACVVNLGRAVEISGAYQSSRTTDTSGDFPADAWSTSGGLKAKTNIIPLENGRFGLAVSGAVGFDLINRQTTSYAVNVPLTFQVLETFRLNVNGGWLYDRIADLHYYTWGGGFEWGLITTGTQLTLIGEIFGQGGQHTDPLYIVEPRAQIGFRVTPKENLDIDLIYGRNIAGENANWYTVGMNFRF